MTAFAGDIQKEMGAHYGTLEKLRDKAIREEALKEALESLPKEKLLSVELVNKRGSDGIWQAIGFNQALGECREAIKRLVKEVK